MTDSDAKGLDAGEAFSRHSGQVFRYLLRRTGDVYEAEELTQQVFADAAAALAHGDHPHSLLAWLYSVAERRFVDEARRRARAADFVRALSSTSSAQPDLEYGRTIAKALRRGIEELPPDQRRVVVMKVFEDRSFAEIARALDTTEAACKMRFSRGIRRLRNFLRDEGMAP